MAFDQPNTCSTPYFNVQITVGDVPIPILTDREGNYYVESNLNTPVSYKMQTDEMVNGERESQSWPVTPYQLVLQRTSEPLQACYFDIVVDGVKVKSCTLEQNVSRKISGFRDKGCVREFLFSLPRFAKSGTDRLAAERRNQVGLLQISCYQADHLNDSFHARKSLQYEQASKRDCVDVTGGDYTMSTTKVGRILYAKDASRRVHVWRKTRLLHTVNVRYHMGHTLREMGIEVPPYPHIPVPDPSELSYMAAGDASRYAHMRSRGNINLAPSLSIKREKPAPPFIDLTVDRDSDGDVEVVSVKRPKKEAIELNECDDEERQRSDADASNRSEAMDIMESDSPTSNHVAGSNKKEKIVVKKSGQVTEVSDDDADDDDDEDSSSSSGSSGSSSRDGPNRDVEKIDDDELDLLADSDDDAVVIDESSSSKQIDEIHLLDDDSDPEPSKDNERSLTSIKVAATSNVSISTCDVGDKETHLKDTCDVGDKETHLKDNAMDTDESGIDLEWTQKSPETQDRSAESTSSIINNQIPAVLNVEESGAKNTVTLSDINTTVTDSVIMRIGNSEESVMRSTSRGTPDTPAVVLDDVFDLLGGAQQTATKSASIEDVNVETNVSDNTRQEDSVSQENEDLLLDTTDKNADSKCTGMASVSVAMTTSESLENVVSENHRQTISNSTGIETLEAVEDVTCGSREIVTSTDKPEAEESKADMSDDALLDIPDFVTSVTPVADLEKSLEDAPDNLLDD